jgi:hypothetical protein
MSQVVVGAQQLCKDLVLQQVVVVVELVWQVVDPQLCKGFGQPPQKVRRRESTPCTSSLWY